MGGVPTMLICILGSIPKVRVVHIYNTLKYETTQTWIDMNGKSVSLKKNNVYFAENSQPIFSSLKGL